MEYSTGHFQSNCFSICAHGAGVAQRLCNGLSRNDPGLDSLWERCKNRASRPSQGTVNGAPSLNDLTVDGTLNTTNQPYALVAYLVLFQCGTMIHTNLQITKQFELIVFTSDKGD